MAITAVLMVPNGGRYFYAVVLPEDDCEADDLASLSLWLVLGYNLLLLLAIFLFFDVLNRFYQLDQLWYLVPAYGGIYGLYNIELYASVRKKRFRTNALAKITQTASVAILSIAASLSGFLNSGLVLGKSAGVLASVPVLNSKPIFVRNIQRLKHVALKYIEYPKITIVPSLLDIFSVQALIFFVGKYYSEQTLGFLGLTNMILIAPLALIGISFRDVFYQKAASLFHRRAFGDVRRLFFISAAVLFAIGGMLAVLVYVFGESIFSFVYGKNWSISGKYASILGFAFWAKLTVSPLSSIFNAAHQLKLASVWQTTYFISTFSLLIICCSIYSLSIEVLLSVYALHEIILYTIYFVLEVVAIKRFK